MLAGYICERIDNMRLSFANALPSSDSRVDVKTGILTLPQAGSATVTWELGVGGNGISASGTWNSYNTTTTEYSDTWPSVAQSGSAQSDSTCGDQTQAGRAFLYTTTTHTEELPKQKTPRVCFPKGR